MYIIFIIICIFIFLHQTVCIEKCLYEYAYRYILLLVYSITASISTVGMITVTTVILVVILILTVVTVLILIVILSTVTTVSTTTGGRAPAADDCVLCLYRTIRRRSM